VVLVGHSYGGMVISGVADRVPERLAHLVYLDAEVPMDGQSELDVLPPEERAGYEEAARSKGQGSRIPPPLPEPLPEDLDPRVRWTMLRMVPQPLGHVRSTAAPDERGGPRGEPRLCALHSRQGRRGATRVRPARAVGSGVAIRGARGRTSRTRDRTTGTRRRAGPAHAAWLGSPRDKVGSLGDYCQSRC
jgi:pimeloyl-ACP methyl ester carboxylesterase